MTLMYESVKNRGGVRHRFILTAFLSDAENCESSGTEKLCKNILCLEQATNTTTDV